MHERCRSLDSSALRNNHARARPLQLAVQWDVSGRGEAQRSAEEGLEEEVQVAGVSSKAEAEDEVAGGKSPKTKVSLESRDQNQS